MAQQQPGAQAMKRLVQEGNAMPAPGEDRPGRFPVRNRDDLAKAVRAVGRVRPPTEDARAKVRRYIMRRAEELGATDMIPGDWDSSGHLRSA